MRTGTLPVVCSSGMKGGKVGWGGNYHPCSFTMRCVWLPQRHHPVFWDSAWPPLAQPLSMWKAQLHSYNSSRYLWLRVSHSWNCESETNFVWINRSVSPTPNSHIPSIFMKPYTPAYVNNEQLLGLWKARTEEGRETKWGWVSLREFWMWNLWGG